MKKINWLYFAIVIAVAIACDPKKPDSKNLSGGDTPAPIVVDTPRTFISLAQLVLDTLIEAEGPTLLEETKSGNLKKIWKYDERLYLESSNSNRKFIVTKEINPCCPCSGTETACCICLIDTDFAAVSDMEARATLDGTDMKTTSSIPNVEIFSIPANTPDGTHTLKIKGRAVPEVTYTVTIVGRTMQFK